MKKRYRPWLKAFSAISGNISAAWFAVPFIAPSISFPKDKSDFLVLTYDIGFGIVFLFLTVWCEGKLEK